MRHLLRQVLLLVVLIVFIQQVLPSPLLKLPLWGEMNIRGFVNLEGRLTNLAVFKSYWQRMLREKRWKQTFFLSHFLEVIFSDKRDSGFGFVWSLLLHVNLKILLSVPERSLLWAVLTTRRRTL